MTICRRGFFADILVCMAWKDRIISEPGILRGKPCIKGTRIPVSLVLGYLAAERSTAEILAEFPDLTPADITATLDYARDLADFEVAAST